MRDLIQDWRNSKIERENAESWNDLPNGRRYQNDKFNISEPHSRKPMLCRAGQQTCGGNNYWKTGEEFNAAMLQYLIDGWADHYPHIIKLMKEKENQALKQCQSYVDKMQGLINDAE